MGGREELSAQVILIRVSVSGTDGDVITRDDIPRKAEDQGIFGMTKVLNI